MDPPGYTSSLAGGFCPSTALLLGPAWWVSASRRGGHSDTRRRWRPLEPMHARACPWYAGKLTQSAPGDTPTNPTGTRKGSAPGWCAIARGAAHGQVGETKTRHKSPTLLFALSRLSRHHSCRVQLLASCTVLSISGIWGILLSRPPTPLARYEDQRWDSGEMWDCWEDDKRLFLYTHLPKHRSSSPPQHPNPLGAMAAATRGWAQ